VKEAVDTPAKEFLRLYGREAWTDWQRLRIHFELDAGFAFLVLLVPGAVGAEICRRDLEEFLRSRGKTLCIVDCRSRGNVRRLPELVLAIEPTPEVGGIWLGAAIPESDPEIEAWRAAWRRGLALLNQQRNTLRRRFKFPLVLVGAPWLKVVAREAAPDLWSIRTAVVHITPAPAPEPLVERGAAGIHALTGEAAADPDYAMEYAERLAGRPGLEAQRASLLFRAGRGFYELRRIGAALSTWQEATQLLRGLAEEEPQRFLPGLAGSVNNLSLALADFGRREEALDAAKEALEIYRQLAKSNPDAFMPDLAMSLNNLARGGTGGYRGGSPDIPPTGEI